MKSVMTLVESKPLLFLFLSTIASTSFATIQDFDGFEDPPYIAGTSINGQQGWLTTGAVSQANIVTSGPDHGELPLAGSQSFYMKDTDSSGFARHRIAGTTLQNGTSLTWLQQITGGAWSTVTANRGDGPTYAQVEFNSGGDIFALTSGGNVDIGNYTAGDVYEVEAVFDYTNNKYEVVLNNLTTGSGPVSTGLHSFVTPTNGTQAGVGNLAQILLRMRSGGLFDDIVFDGISAPVSDIDTGFEAPEFVVANANFQGEWFITGSGTFGDIVTSAPTGGQPALSGSQSLFMEGSGFARHSLLGQSALDGTSLKWRQQITDGDWSTVTLNSDTLGAIATYAQVEFNSNGNIFALTNTGNVDIGNYTAGDIYEVEMKMAYSSNQYEVILNNLTSGGGPLSAGLHGFVVPTTAAQAVGGPDAAILLRMRSGGLFDNVEFLTPAGLLGDYNDDGYVDAADYTVWRNNFGDPDETDLNGNGDGGGVGTGDYTLWKSQYGTGTPPGGGGGLAKSTAVPEPTAGSLLLVLCTALSSIRCRRIRMIDCINRNPSSTGRSAALESLALPSPIEGA